MDVITHAMRRERWKAIIKECNESGMNKGAWLAEHNINPKTYYNWQRKLRMEVGTELVLARNNELTSAHGENDFCPLEKPIITGKTGVVICAGNISVEIHENISDDFLMRIMKAASHV